MSHWTNKLPHSCKNHEHRGDHSFAENNFFKRKKKEKASFPLHHSKRHRVHDRGYWHVFNYIDKTNLHIQNKSTLLMQAKNLI